MQLFAFSELAAKVILFLQQIIKKKILFLSKKVFLTKFTSIHFCRKLTVSSLKLIFSALFAPKFICFVYFCRRDDFEIQKIKKSKIPRFQVFMNF